MLKCKDIVAQADQVLAGELTGRQRVAVRLHLMMCRHCRRYVRHLRALLRAIPHMHRPASRQEVAAVIERIEHSD